MKVFSFDTEFRGSNNKQVEPVAASIRYDNIEKNYFFPQDKDDFIIDFNELVKDRSIVVYFASAEVRFLLALGYAPQELLTYKWLDVFVLWRMLTHSHPKYKYGRYFKKSKDGEWVEKLSKKPPQKEELWVEDDEGNLSGREPSSGYASVPTSLVGAVGHRLGICLDSTHKDAMRDLILKGCNEFYSAVEKQAILDYCSSDTKYLKPLLVDLLGIVRNITGNKFGLTQLVELSRYPVCCGVVESNGIPIDVEKAKNLGGNFIQADTDLIKDCNTFYNFYIERKTTKAEKEKGFGVTKFVESYSQFKNYVELLGLAGSWPRSEKGSYKKDTKTLKEYEADPAIMTFWRTKDSRNQLKYFRPEGFAKIEENIGEDDRVRVLLGPFGSKTGRNQPSVAKGYVFGMSSWIRPLIEHKEKIVLGADFSAQEIALQGFVSGDDNFIEAYKSGDPYTWFAQMTGGMPSGTARKKGKFFDECMAQLPPEMQVFCATTRNVYKALLLGVGFGMGLNKLADSLTMARISGLTVEEKEVIRRSRTEATPELLEQAEALLSTIRLYGQKPVGLYVPPANLASTYKGMHQKLFKRYWRWREDLVKKYHAVDFLMLADGWCLFEGEDRQNTVANFPIQGLGAVILRRAMYYALMEGLEVISPLHDCIYILAESDKVEETGARLVACMKKAVADYCGSDLIRIDYEQYKTDWVNFTSTWTKDKGGAALKSLGKYMTENINKGESV